MSWNTNARERIDETLRDPVVKKLLEKSNLTRAQFETVLVDQLGTDLAAKNLTRDEMSELRLGRGKTSRGAFNRTLSQARTNVAQSIHTILLLGYVGILDSPGLAQFVDASETLRTTMARMRDSVGQDRTIYDNLVNSLLEDLERATGALRGKRDM